MQGVFGKQPGRDTATLYRCTGLDLFVAALFAVQGVFGKQRSSLAEKIEGSTAGTAAVRYPQLLRRLVKALPLFDPQQMSSLGKNTYGGPLLQAMLRAAAHDE